LFKVQKIKLPFDLGSSGKTADCLKVNLETFSGITRPLTSLSGLPTTRELPEICRGIGVDPNGAADYVLPAR
tara:strand:- start:834 stop:1049 length:216 start_codon:yes stop_codon:yes gene_type:complete